VKRETIFPNFVAAELEGCLLRKNSSRLMFRVEKFEPESETTGHPNDYTSQGYALLGIEYYVAGIQEQVSEQTASETCPCTTVY
jgi:hypothetical protein